MHPVTIAVIIVVIIITIILLYRVREYLLIRAGLKDAALNSTPASRLADANATMRSMNDYQIGGLMGSAKP